MKTWALSLSLWGLLVGLAASDSSGEYLYKGDPDASAVIEHTTKTDFEASSKPRLVEFYSPYCGGCRNFKPKYISMAEQMNAKYADVEVYAVSCAPFKEICNKHKIKGYPSLYAFPAGATEGTYLQKSSMGGSYEISMIAESLKLSKGSSSASAKATTTTSSSKTTTSVKTKRSLAVESDDEPAAKKVVKTTLTKKTSLKKDDADSEESVKATTKTLIKKGAASKKEEDSEDATKKTVATKKTTTEKDEESEDVVKTTSKKTLTKKPVIKAAASEDEKESSKEDEDASIDKQTAIKKRQLVDEKEDDKDDEKEEEISEDKDDEKEEKISEDKDDEKDEEALKKKKEDEKEDDKDEEISKDDEKEDDKEEEVSKDKEKEDDKEEEISKDDEKEEEEAEKDEGISKDDEKGDTKDDEEEDKDAESEQDKDDEDDKDDEKDTRDDKDDADEEEEETEDDKEDAAVDFRANALRQPNSLASPGARPNRVFTSGAYKPGRNPGAGAQKAGLKQRDMDRWKTVMEQRKKMMEAKRSGATMNFLRPVAESSKGPGGKIQLAVPGRTGTTKVMRANTPGTQEFEERKKQILARIEKAKKKHGFPLLGSRSKAATTLVKKEMLPFKKEPKAPGLMRRGMEKVPIVKRAFRMSPEEELILDASLSFVTGLKHGVFMSADSLNDKKKDALKSWLDLLSVSLPPEWGLHALIDDLSKNLNFVAKSNANLQKIIAKHPSARQVWSKSCDKKGTGGFSCGMWKLFHIVSLGVAEHHGGSNLIDSGLVSASTRTFSPADAADVVRDYMANFFGCDDCRKHFLAQYESCAFRRCDRLSDDASSASPDDWKQLALWMWEVHNDVNIRVANKKVERLQTKLNSKHLQGAQTLKLSQKQEDEIKVLFPSLDDCVVCFDESGKWNEDSVFEYLERTYWDAPDAKFDRLLTYRKVEGEDPSGGGFVWIMMIIALCIVVSLRRHVSNISFHKHFQTASMTSVGNKIGDAVAGKKRTA